MYFVVNSGAALSGPVYIDNVRGIQEGGTVTGDAAPVIQEQKPEEQAKPEENAKTQAQQPAASGNSIVFWNFEDGTTGGWQGKGKWAEACKVNNGAAFVSEGKNSLKIEAKGSKGYNQDIAIFDGPFNENFGKCKSMTMDVFVPKETIKGMDYLQIFVVISGSANSWYQIPQALKPGWNKLVYQFDSSNMDGDLWHMYFVVNSGSAAGGPIYVDNVLGIM
jgi:hypothetical protein